MTSTSKSESDLPTLRYKIGSAVVPGDRIGTIRQIAPGPGTYLHSNGHVYASLAGTLTVERTIQEEDVEMKDANNKAKNDKKPSASSDKKPPFTCSIVSQAKLPATSQVLQTGQIVIGTVTRIQPQMAVVEIQIAGGVGVVKTPAEGCIRLEDIRGGASVVNSRSSTTTSTTTNMHDCFRPHDVVACRIVSLGDSRRYFLSTAETELGVLRAYSQYANKSNSNGRSNSTAPISMIPVSWKEMECPLSGKREPRKCAKPIALQQQPKHA